MSTKSNPISAENEKGYERLYEGLSPEQRFQAMAALRAKGVTAPTVPDVVKYCITSVAERKEG